MGWTRIARVSDVNKERNSRVSRLTNLALALRAPSGGDTLDCCAIDALAGRDTSTTGADFLLDIETLKPGCGLEGHTEGNWTGGQTGGALLVDRCVSGG